MLTRTLAPLSFSLLLAACDSAPKPAPAAAPQPAAAPTIATTVATTVAPPAKPAKPAKPRLSARERALAGFDKTTASGQAQSFRDQLAAGRKAVKDKQYAAGITAFTAALKVDPNHPAALAELGWAAYLAGDLATARRHTEQAIASQAPDHTRGAALYNLGRILEDSNDKDAAALAYQRSLQLRPNAVVTQRLAGLTRAGADTTSHDCDLVLQKGAPPADLCAALVAALPPDEMITSRECDPQDSEPGEVVVDAAGTPMGGDPTSKIDHTLPDGVRIAHFRVQSWMEAGGSSDEVYLAVLHRDRWYTTRLGEAYNPGLGYIGASFDVEKIEVQDVITGGRPELVITMSAEYHDGDYSENTTEGTSRRDVAVLGLDGDAPRWLGTFTVHNADDTGPMIDGEPSDGAVKHSENNVDYRLDPATGEVVLIAITGQTPSTPPGRYKLGALPAACPEALGYVGN